MVTGDGGPRPGSNPYRTSHVHLQTGFKQFSIMSCLTSSHTERKVGVLTRQETDELTNSAPFDPSQLVSAFVEHQVHQVLHAAVLVRSHFLF